MSVKIQIIIGIFIVLLLLSILNMVRTRKIDLKYSLSWITALVIVLIMDIFPQIIFFIADLVGISLPSNMVFFFGIIVLAVLIYNLTASVSRLSEKVKRLIQEVALLEKKVAALENNKTDNEREEE